MKLTAVEPPKITQHQNFTTKQITLAPPKGKIMTRNQIKKFCQDLEKKLPEGAEMLVRAENLVKTVPLYSTYDQPWKTDEEFDEYFNEADEGVYKFKAFLNFTVTLLINKSQLDDKKQQLKKDCDSENCNVDMINIETALKKYYGNKYDKNCYDIYLKMKKYGCYAIIPSNEFYHVQFTGNSNVVDLENNMIDKKYFEENCMMFRNKFRCKIKNIYFDDEIIHANNNGSMKLFTNSGIEIDFQYFSIACSTDKNRKIIDCCCELYEELPDHTSDRDANFYYFIENIGTNENDIPKIISIEEALKYFYGDKYSANDYEIYKKIKQNNCYKFFLIIDDNEMLFCGNKSAINFDNDTIENESFKKFCFKYPFRAKLKNVYFKGEKEFEFYKENPNKVLLYTRNKEEKPIDIVCELFENYDV